MSTQPIGAPAMVKVCDLCGKPVDTYTHADWSRLNVGYGSGVKEKYDLTKTKFNFLRFSSRRRDSGAPKGDYREWEWDFHGECLFKALNPLIVTNAKQDIGVKE